MSFCKRIIPDSAKQTFWLAFTLCLFGCFFILFVVSPLTGLSEHFGKAHDGYIQIAENLGQGNGFVFEKGGPLVFHRPPMYPFLLTPITLLPDSMERPALILVQSIMIGFIAAMIFNITLRFFNLRTAQAAVVIFLLNPWVYWNAKNPMTAILQALLYILFMALLGNEFFGIRRCQQSDAGGGRRLWLKRLVIGVVAAALALTHGAMLAVGLMLLFILFLAAILWRNRQVLITSIVALILMALLVAPWTYRNWVVFHRFIPIVGGSGMGYFNGIIHWRNTAPEPQREGESHVDACLRLAGIEGTAETHIHWKGLKYIEIEDQVNKKAIEHLRGHPSAFVKKTLLNTVEYYFPALAYPYLAVKYLSFEQVALTAFHLLLWILVIVSILRDKAAGISLKSTWLLLAAIGLYAVWYLPFSVFIGHSLYTLGTIPLLSILAARGLIPRFSG